MNLCIKYSFRFALLLLISACFGASADSSTKKFLNGPGSLPVDRNGKQVDQEQVRLFNEIQLKSKSGDPESQYKLGVYYLTGKAPVEKDEKIAESWFLKSAQQGYVRSFTYLEQIHSARSRIAATPVDSSRELAQAYQWAYLSNRGPVSLLSGRQLSEQTKIEGTELARQFLEKYGVPVSGNQPSTSAVGNVSAVGASNLTDDSVIKYNEVKSRALAGDAASQFKMAGYAENPPSRLIVADKEAKVSWLLKAADQVYTPAIFELQSYYLNQASLNGNRPDLLSEAYKWKILYMWYVDQKEWRYNDAMRISEATFNEASRRAQEFKSRHVTASQSSLAGNAAEDLSLVGTGKSVAVDDRVIMYNEVKNKALGGDPAAQYKMAQYCEVPPSRSVPPDKAGHLTWLQKSAEKLYVPAINDLAYYFLSLSRRDSNNADFLAESFKWRIIYWHLTGEKHPWVASLGVSEATYSEAQRRADAFLEVHKPR